jgi:uncharacterized Zn finger protein
MSYGNWKPDVPVAKRRAQAEKSIAKGIKSGQDLQPVNIEGRTIAKTFWGKAWCDNLERYSDFSNRLPRGRSYLRQGSVIDLKIEPGKVRAQVVGSQLYQVEIGIAAVSAPHWKTLTQACTGSIASLVELLQGRLSTAVMERLCQPKTGLFPEPKDLQFDCSCPDWATMCKHVAAVLYGVGARLDKQPELLFKLRQVDANALLTQATELSAQSRKTPARSKVLDDAELADVFGIDLDMPTDLAAPGNKSGKKAEARKTAPKKQPAAAPKTAVKKKASATPLKKMRSVTETPPRKARAPAPGKSASTAATARKSAAKKPALKNAATKTPGKTKGTKVQA